MSSVGAPCVAVDSASRDAAAVATRWQERRSVPRAIVVERATGKVLAAVGSSDYRDARAGAVDFVVKPAGAERLQVSLKNALKLGALEHEIRYKGTIPEAQAPDLNRRFTLAAGLLELADHFLICIREGFAAALHQ